MGFVRWCLKQLYDYALNYLKEYQRDIIEKDIVYLFCQKWIMNGVVAGAVK